MPTSLRLVLRFLVSGLIGSGFAAATRAQTWIQTSGGTYGWFEINSPNWLNNTPPAAGGSATITNSLTGNQVIALNFGGPNLNQLTIGATNTPSFTYTLLAETAASDFLTFSGASATITQAANTGPVAINANLVLTSDLNANVNSTFYALRPITGGFTLTKSGTGLMYLNAANTVSVINVNAGTLSFGQGGTSGSSTGRVNVSSGATVQLNRSDVVTHANTFSGIGTLSQVGTGAVMISGNVSGFGGTLDVSSSAGLTLSPSTLIGNFTKTGTGTLFVPNALSSSGNITINTGTVQIGANGTSGAITATGITVNSSGTLTILRSDNSTLAAGLFGTGTVSNLGTGILTLSGAVSNFTGTLNIGAGLNVTSGATFGNITGTGALNLAENTSIKGNVSHSGGTTVASNKILSLGQTSVSRSFASNLSGAGVLEILGSTSVVLTGNATQTGGTQIKTGATLSVGNGGTSGTLAGDIDISSNGTLSFNHSDVLLLSNNISGFGGISHDGTGLLTLTGTVTASGNIAVNGTGLLRMETAYAPSVLVKTGTGILSLRGATTPGSSQVKAGTLRVTVNGTLTGAVAIDSGATLDFNKTTDYTFAGAISGAGGLLVSGGSNTTLTGALTYTGDTAITSGTLTINGATTFRGNTTGAGALVKAGTGQLSITQPLAHTGGTTIAAGQLNFGGTTFSGPLTISSGATLSLTNTGTPTYDFSLSGAGGLSLNTGSSALPKLTGSLNGILARITPSARSSPAAVWAPCTKTGPAP
jgi:fibronectin-binding autotransporter adhesin